MASPGPKSENVDLELSSCSVTAATSSNGSGFSTKIGFRSFKINRKDGGPVNSCSQVSLIQNLRLRKKSADDEDELPVREELISIGSDGDMEIRGGAAAAQHLVIPCKYRIQAATQSADALLGALDLDSGSGLKFRIKRCPSVQETIKTECGESEDDLAAMALLREARGEQPPESPYVIPGPILTRNAELANLRTEGLSEKEILRRELQRLPDVTYESYEAVPIDQFGLAMLYGMGYDPSIHTTQACELKKRIYQRAGLGADKEFEVGAKGSEV